MARRAPGRRAEAAGETASLACEAGRQEGVKSAPPCAVLTPFPLPRGEGTDVGRVWRSKGPPQETIPPTPSCNETNLSTYSSGALLASRGDACVSRGGHVQAAQTIEGAVLNLADTLARQPQRVADLLQGVHPLAEETETADYHPCLR